MENGERKKHKVLKAYAYVYVYVPLKMYIYMLKTFGGDGRPVRVYRVYLMSK